MSPYITPNKKGKEAAVKRAGFASRYLIGEKRKEEEKRHEKRKKRMEEET